MDDLEFVHRFVKKDPQARNQFIKRYTRLIYNYIHQVLEARNPQVSIDTSEDIFQGFIEYLIEEDCKRLKAFKAKNGCTLATWIRYLTINFTRGYLRKFKPDLSLDLETESGSMLKDILVDGSFSVTETLSLDERIKTLDECVDALSDDEKYFIELNFNQRVSLEILREFLSLSRGAIDMHKSRIIKRLKDCFETKGFELDS
jgi:RNA polymerase sigma factor (sigma-70 family)